MGRKFNLEVVTPDAKFFDGETDMAILRTTEGDLGILFDHEPLVAPLKVGSIRIRQDDGAFRVASCASGFLTVAEEKVTVITDASEWADDIDLERAEAARERAEKRIREGANKEVDVLRAKAALERAANRIRLYNGK